MFSPVLCMGWETALYLGFGEGSNFPGISYGGGLIV